MKTAHTRHSTPARADSDRPFGKARILLVDDHPVVREGLSVAISQTSDLEVCGQAGSASQALQAVAALRPDVTVIDLSLNGSNGLDLLKDLRTQYPEIRVLVFSMHDEMLYAERAARAGARGYLMKKEPPEQLLEAIRKIHRGALAFSETLVWRLHQEISSGKRQSVASPVARLTDRELAVLEAIGRGRKSREIAADLHVSVKTVQAHCEHMKDKLELPDFMSLVRFAVHWLDTAFDAEQNPTANPAAAPCPNPGERPERSALTPGAIDGAKAGPESLRPFPGRPWSKRDLATLADEVVQRLSRQLEAGPAS